MTTWSTEPEVSGCLFPSCLWSCEGHPDPKSPKMGDIKGGSFAGAGRYSTPENHLMRLTVQSGGWGVSTARAD